MPEVAPIILMVRLLIFSVCLLEFLIRHDEDEFVAILAGILGRVGERGTLHQQFVLMTTLVTKPVISWDETQ